MLSFRVHFGGHLKKNRTEDVSRLYQQEMCVHRREEEEQQHNKYDTHDLFLKLFVKIDI